MASLWVEMKCPEHGIERFQIRIVKKFNVKSDTITPKFRNRPTVGDLSCLLVGRNVSDGEIEKFLTSYFSKKGLIETILKMKFV